MVQWVNHLWNNIFVNPPPLSLLCEISGALHLAQPGLTAGGRVGRQRPASQPARPYGRWVGRLAGIQLNFENFKVSCSLKYSTCCFYSQGTASLQPYQCIPASIFR